MELTMIDKSGLSDSLRGTIEHIWGPGEWHAAALDGHKGELHIGEGGKAVFATTEHTTDVLDTDALVYTSAKEGALPQKLYDIRAHQEAQGWTDATLLELLITYVENQQSPEALSDFLSEMSSPPDHSDVDLDDEEARIQAFEDEGMTRSDAQGCVMAEDMKWSKAPEAYEYMSLDDVSECIDGITNPTSTELWELVHQAEVAGKAKPLGGDGSDGTTDGTTEEPIVSNGDYGTDLVAGWPKLSIQARKNIHQCAEKGGGGV